MQTSEPAPPSAPCPPQSDVDEALRLMKMSKASLYDDAGAERAVDPISQVGPLPCPAAPSAHERACYGYR